MLLYLLDAQNLHFSFQNLLLIKNFRCSFINCDKKDQKKAKFCSEEFLFKHKLIREPSQEV